MKNGPKKQDEFPLFGNPPRLWPADGSYRGFHLENNIEREKRFTQVGFDILHS
jgi:hypothetical protein